MSINVKSKAWNPSIVGCNVYSLMFLCMLGKDETDSSEYDVSGATNLILYTTGEP